MKQIGYAIAISLGTIVAFAAGSTNAQDNERAAATANIEQVFGFVPTFMHQMPTAGFSGAWQQLRDLEFSEGTALSAKTKALIALAVVSQIPCHYCIWADSASARQAGASEEEIAEAVAVAATERYWSTMLNGLQVDFETFRHELGPILGVEVAAQ